MPKASQAKKASNLLFAQQVVDPDFAVREDLGINFTEVAYSANKSFAAIEHSDPVLYDLLAAQLQQERQDLSIKLLDETLGK